MTQKDPQPGSLKTTFIGLGVMGFPMAGHLAARHEVTVFNRSADKASRWTEHYAGQRAETPAEAVKDADMVFCCLGADEDVEAILTGEGGVLNAMKSGSLLCDHTTTSAELARRMGVAATEAGVRFVDAPVSGGQKGAEDGALTIMMGGAEKDCDELLPVLECYAKRARRLGEVGAGQLTKMVNQICIAGLVQGLAEGIQFAKKAGLDPAEVVDVISKGAAQSWQMENRYQTMIEGQYDFGFAVEWMRKDLNYALAEGRRNKSHLPVTALVDQFYSEVESLGGARWDTSSLLARLENLSRTS
ncbi:2-hydroxy-3-oxopropionate reductase [Litorivivens lipolytica]|uniref:2-hydroxy-3-oxopropionate reductase n=1 Tax=Litorivivens lipolytica TaxID=1524264 RepID=A0A7W4W335_9GAMM|nr:NAD(P)-dependent oxidoreductase [Litorivivens lipolytica]MBB3046017.1 2-hydroxy-3-oxopropionate reductase [Litorivivens lipolytica]